MCCGRSATVHARQPPSASVPCARPSAADRRSSLSPSPGSTPLSLLPSHSSPRRPPTPVVRSTPSPAGDPTGGIPVVNLARSALRCRRPPRSPPPSPSRSILVAAGLRHGGSRPPPPGLGEGASRGVGDEAWRRGGGATGPQPGCTGRDDCSTRVRRRTAAGLGETGSGTSGRRRRRRLCGAAAECVGEGEGAADNNGERVFFLAFVLWARRSAMIS
ncbi:hypothetical protein PVAP13_1KG433400 [Panicum virgatum]|uniref:Uncharacterized protein n=1 Tax=Panicum virgatum TaxID=38727 RepID=A0A8T0XTG4_PANVG|nr:hypothetical protein PVAP13_1KG433400 [Panicum virgatum]